MGCNNIIIIILLEFKIQFDHLGVLQVILSTSILYILLLNMKILSVGIVLGALLTLTPAANLEAETKFNHNAEEASKYKCNINCYHTMILL